MQPSGKSMREFVKFAEFPLSIWGVSAAADVRRVLVIFLEMNVNMNDRSIKHEENQPRSNGRKNTLGDRVR